VVWRDIETTEINYKTGSGGYFYKYTDTCNKTQIEFAEINRIMRTKKEVKK